MIKRIRDYLNKYGLLYNSEFTCRIHIKPSIFAEIFYEKTELLIGKIYCDGEVEIKDNSPASYLRYYLNERNIKFKKSLEKDIKEE